jgi:hypothetical protein
MFCYWGGGTYCYFLNVVLVSPKDTACYDPLANDDACACTDSDKITELEYFDGSMGKRIEAGCFTKTIQEDGVRCFVLGRKGECDEGGECFVIRLPTLFPLCLALFSIGCRA